MTRRYSGARAIMLMGAAALAATGCATERAAARPARAEAPAATASNAQPKTVYIDIRQATAEPARAQGPDVRIERTRIIEAPAAAATVQIPQSRVVIEPQAPRILVDQRPPEVVIGDMPQPQLYLRQGGGESGRPSTSAIQGDKGDLTKVIQVPAPTVSVQLPRSRVVIQSEPARVIVNQQPPEVVLEPMPLPRVTAGERIAPAASPATR